MFSYIGICDSLNGEESLRSAQLFQRLCDDYGVTDCKLMIGAMMSFKSLNGIPSRGARVFPKKEEVSGIFVDHPLAFCTLHYADYDFNTSLVHLIEVGEWAGPFCHAIQLDMIWPPDVILKGFRRRFPNMQIVLQINRPAFKEVRNNPETLVEQLQLYRGLVDYVLLDKSHGTGQSMKANELLPFALAVAEHLPWLGIGAAGGLGPGSVGLIEPLVEAIPTISWDAQGKLRRSGNADDPIDGSMSDQYLLESVQLRSKYK